MYTFFLLVIFVFCLRVYCLLKFMEISIHVSLLEIIIWAFTFMIMIYLKLLCVGFEISNVDIQ